MQIIQKKLKENKDEIQFDQCTEKLENPKKLSILLLQKYRKTFMEISKTNTMIENIYSQFITYINNQVKSL